MSGRVKRQARNGLKLCQKFSCYKGLMCIMDRLSFKCHFQTSNSCGYTIACRPNRVTFQMCDTVHTWTGIRCCDPYCP